MKTLISFISFLSLFLSLPTLATWQLDNEQSIVSFVSVKKADVAESHHFDLLEGMIQTNGTAKVKIALASVNSGIEIRNTRLKEMLFKTDVFPSAIITANISNKFIDELALSASSEIMLQGRLELNDKKKSVQIPTWVTKVSETKLMVTSIKPVIINAKDFGLEEGVQQLKEIASLPSISNAVPVSFVLTFIREK
ncbi:YceI family protein [Thalassotalea psychrophila]|uniref:YceI family protein n=1 Tax=Thalassotalea psychrophila TaxID=3065647 RepID=A0ABY9TT14_9GAMM|nr:YceI family protein [Colwelliaceae bacterium SQ149]